MRRTAHAVLLIAGIALGSGAADAAPKGARPKRPKDELARARALDKEGARAYAAGRFNDAITDFEEAYRLGGPAFELWNVAKCYLRLEQPDRAAEMLERYLAIADLPKEDRAEATKQLDSIKKRTSLLTVTSTPSGAQVTIDGKPMPGKTPIASTLSAGEHTISVAMTPTSEPYVEKVDAEYGRAIKVEATLGAATTGGKNAGPPDNPYEEESAAARPLAVRAAVSLVLPKYGSIGGGGRFGMFALGTYKISDVGPAAIAVGGLLGVTSDSWENRTGIPNQTASCGMLKDPDHATAFSLLALGTATFPIIPKVRAVGIGGLGLTAISVDDLGGDLFKTTCKADPGVRPALMLGTEIDVAVTNRIRVSAFPLTWQLQPAFAGTRTTPRDASGIWMRFGISLGAGVDF